MEPVDIANWYFMGFHDTPSGHYIDQCSGESAKRPGRYILLQQLEMAVLGTNSDSLELARTLKAHFEGEKVSAESV